jgi:LPXTG-motif cell wall-anchored protein
MKIGSVLPVAAAALAIGVLGLPTAALAADSDTAHLTALTELHPDGTSVQFPIHPGETVPVVAGVVNQGDKGVQGITVHLRIVDDLNLPAEFTNCQYYVDSNLHGAWCSLDGLVPPVAKYALSPLHVSAAKDATKPGSALIVEFYSKDFTDGQGGIEALAKADAGKGTTPHAGTGGTLGLTGAPDLPLPKDPKYIGFVSVKLIVPSSSPSSSPSASPSTSTSPSTGTGTSTSSSPTAPAAAGPGANGGGGLAITGSKSAVVAGLGAVLLIGGAAIFFLTRRRRAKFVA